MMYDFTATIKKTLLLQNNPVTKRHAHVLQLNLPPCFNQEIQEEEGKTSCTLPPGAKRCLHQREQSEAMATTQGAALETVCGGLWWSVVVCGVLWWSVVFCGGLWWSVVFCGGLWWSVVVFSVLWWSVVVCSGLWWSVVVCGVL